MSKWKCSVGNPNCHDGWIVTKNGIEETPCECVRREAVLKSYEKWGRGDMNLLKNASNLKDNNVRAYSPDKMDELLKMTDSDSEKRQEIESNTPVKSYLETIDKIVANFDKLEEANAKLYFFGDVGTGKSQLSSKVMFDVINKYDKLGLFIKASELKHVLFDFSEKGKAYRERLEYKAKDEDTRLLIIDDIGRELPREDNRLDTITDFYTTIFRDFQEKEGVILFTSNKSPDELLSLFKRDKRLFDVIFQMNNTRFYEVSNRHNFRQETESDLSFLD